MSRTFEGLLLAQSPEILPGSLANGRPLTRKRKAETALELNSTGTSLSMRQSGQCMMLDQVPSTRQAVVNKFALLAMIFCTDLLHAEQVELDRQENEPEQPTKISPGNHSRPILTPKAGRQLLTQSPPATRDSQQWLKQYNHSVDCSAVLSAALVTAKPACMSYWHCLDGLSIVTSIDIHCMHQRRMLGRLRRPS